MERPKILSHEEHKRITERSGSLQPVVRQIGTQLKAISLWEPWATGMALELKRNETRSWPTAFRGDLAICSAKRSLDQDCLAVARENGIPITALRFGFVLCVVEMFDCAKSEAFLSGMIELTEQEQALGNYTYGRWIWRTRNCRRLETPVPVVGRQGFWTLPPETLALVKANLPNVEVRDPAT